MLDTIPRCEYNKVVHENDELRGDIISLDREIDNLLAQLSRRQPNHTPQKEVCRFWSYFWFSLCCGLAAASTSYVYQLRQELAFWKCEPSYQQSQAPKEVK